MKKVVIIGCGYGGICAAWRLSAGRDKMSITVIDRSESFNFLPLLPDCLGRMLDPRSLAYPIKKLSAIYGFDFVKDEAVSLDLAGKKVITSAGAYDYDYLIIASGSETNFYGNKVIEERAFRLDNARDARKICLALSERDYDSYLICGGGYTGVEIATNLRIYLDRRKINKRIIIIERSDSILGPLPAWMKEYALGNLKDLGIEVLLKCSVETVEGSAVRISGDKVLEDCMLIWSAGVKTSGFLQDLSCEKNPQGRVKVDEYLRLDESCFVVGDASYFTHKGAYLRMAVQFAIAQGSLAAVNIMRSSAGMPLQKYRPVDLGYIIPMANNRSCGNILGLDMKGLAPTLLHYCMSVYRAYGVRNKLSIAGTLLNRR